jgi:YD repeat-containing protein
VRLRDGNVIGFAYDALSRMSAKDLPNLATYEFDIAYTYDNRGLMLSANDSNTHHLAFTWDNAGRRTGETGNFYSRAYQYDADGNRTRLTHGDGLYVQYDYDGLDRMQAARENGAASGIGVLASYAYDPLGRRLSLTRGNGTVTAYTYDGASRLTSLAHDLAGTANDVTFTLGTFRARAWHLSSKIEGRADAGSGPA